eukprot:5758874-Karenia_brevis.AAC.1
MAHGNLLYIMLRKFASVLRPGAAHTEVTMANGCAAPGQGANGNLPQGICHMRRARAWRTLQ